MRKVVYIGSTNGDYGNLYAVDASAGTKIWSFPATGWYPQGKPFLRFYQFSGDGKVVYVGTEEMHNNDSCQYLNAVDALDGSKIWSFQTSDVLDFPAALSSDGKVVYISGYLPTSGSGEFVNLYAIDASNGRKLWSFQTGPQSCEGANQADCSASDPRTWCCELDANDCLCAEFGTYFEIKQLCANLPNGDIDCEHCPRSSNCTRDL